MSDPRLDAALSELHAAMAALPPNAVAPLANSFGEVVPADPMHASACVLRAIVALSSLKGALEARGTPPEPHDGQTCPSGCPGPHKPLVTG